MILKGESESGAAGRGRDRREPQPSVATISPALRTIGQVQSRGTLDYHGLLLEVPAPLRQQLLVPELVHLGKAIDLNSDNDGDVTLTNVYDLDYNRGPADYDITHTFASNWIYELPWAREKLSAGGSSAASCICAVACR